MPNPLVEQRLAGIRQGLNGVHQGSTPMSNNTSGAEREAVIDSFLNAVFPSQFRFGTGDATNAQGLRSGQLDVVIENGTGPSLPSIVGGSTRLCLAESISAVIEVKSNLSVQWNQFLSTADALAPVTRTFQGAMQTIGMALTNDIPLFAIGYTGWNQISSLQTHINDRTNLDGILIIDSGLFVSSQRFGGITAQGDWALWGLISCINRANISLRALSDNTITYAM